MLPRFVVAGLIALAVAAALPGPPAFARNADEGYEMWDDCTDLPSPFQFLPIYLGSDSPGFVDLGWDKVFNGKPWRALQYTKDKDFGAFRAVAGRWYGGMGADRWPLGTIDPAKQLAAFRVTAWEVDGNRHEIPSSCVLTFESEDLAVGLYNVWVRFNEPGTHTLKIFGKQVADFPFFAPFAFGPADPLGLGGRRMFVEGEEIYELNDQQFVHSYELHVVSRDEDGGR